MQQTETLKLNLIEGTDTVDPAPINENMKTLEAETTAIRTEMETETTAIRTEMEAETTAIRAEMTSADTALATSLGASLDSLAANLGSVGTNARFIWGSYVGTGTSGTSNPNSLTFDFKPMLVFIRSSTDLYYGWFLRPAKLPVGTNNDQCGVTWTDNGLSWYSATSTGVSPISVQLNISGKTYYYFAIGTDL